MKKQKTKTGALPNSAGFPGRDMIKEQDAVFFNGDKIVKLGELLFPESDYKHKDDHKYWE